MMKKIIVLAMLYFVSLLSCYNCCLADDISSDEQMKEEYITEVYLDATDIKQTIAEKSIQKYLYSFSQQQEDTQHTNTPDQWILDVYTEAYAEYSKSHQCPFLQLPTDITFDDIVYQSSGLLEVGMIIMLQAADAYPENNSAIYFSVYIGDNLVISNNQHQHLAVHTLSEWQHNFEFTTSSLSFGFPRMIDDLVHDTVATDDFENSLFLFQVEQPDYGYFGHSVSLTETEYLKVLRSIYGEQEQASYEMYVGLGQYIRDYIDFGSVNDRTYENLGSRWLIRGGTLPSYMNIDWFQQNVPHLIQAVYYVFIQGGSLGQGRMHFYFDDDDAALGNRMYGQGYEAAYLWLNQVACNGDMNYHNRIHLYPVENPRNWSEFCLGN